MPNNSTEYTINLRDLVSSKLQGVINSFQKTQQEAEKTDNTLMRVGQGVAAYFAIDRVKSFATEVVQVGASYEKLEIQFKNLTKNAEYGEKVFARLKDDAKTSPFGVEELASANAMLMSAGMSADDARTDIQALGNAVAYAGKGNDEFIRMAANMQQIQAVGVATAGDIRQFGIAGINIYRALADATGQPIEKVKEMTVSYDLLSYALRKANTDTGVFAGGVSSMADSTEIKLSNLSETWKNALDDIFKKNKDIINSTIEMGNTMISTMKESIIWIRENSLYLGLFAGVVGATVVAWKAYAFWQNVNKVGSIAYNVILFAQMALQEGLTAALYATGIAGQVMWASLTLGITAVIAGLVIAYNKFQGFRAAIHGIGAVVKQIFTNIGNFFKTTFEPIFKAIDYVKQGKYKEAAKEAGILAYNLSPVGMGINFAKSQTGYIDAYKKGVTDLIANENQGSAIMKGMPGYTKSDFLPFLKGSEFGGASKMLPKATTNNSNGLFDNNSPKLKKDKTTSRAGGGSGNTVNITIGSLVKDLSISVADTKAVVPKIKQEVEKALVALTNDVNVMIYQ